MIQGKYLGIEDDLKQVNSIRKEVFKEEIQNNSSYINEGLDMMSIHALVSDENGKAVGTGRLTLLLDENNDTHYTMDLIGVLLEERKKGYGEFIVRMLADKAMLSGAEEILITCPKACEEFFKKLYFNTKEEAEGVCSMLVKLKDFKHPCQGCH